jgi:predicted nucleic acid-binding protein
VIVVVADTSPLNYLIQIHCEHVLPALYEHVFVPKAVVDELNHPGAVAAVRTWLTHAPSWLMVREVAWAPDAGLTKLDPGERQAIQLAKQEHADLLLMDERLGVRLAREQGLAVTGTLGVLLQAARRGLVDVERALTDLQATDFRCSRRVMEEVRRRAKLST